MTPESLLAPLYEAIGRLLPFAFAQPQFMKRAILATLLVAPTAAAVGVPLVQFRMAFFSDAIGHSAFTGIALGVVMGVHPLATMIAFGLFVAWAIAHVKGRTGLAPDTVVGVFFSAAVALGIAVISAQKGLTRNLQAYLYGDLLAVSDAEILWMAALAAGIGAYLCLAFNRIMLLSTHEGLARTLGVRARAVEVSFCLATALVVTTAIRAVGILLVTALLVIPAATARSAARSVGGAFWVAVAAALLAGIAGIAASYHLDTATGATVVLFAAALFAAAAAAAALRGRAV